MKTLHWNRKTVAAGAAALAAAATLLLVATGGSRAADDPKAAAPAKPALTVSTAAPRRVELPITLAANGNIAAWQEASVGAESGGQRLTEVRVNVGDRVRKGQVLATFAADTLRAESAQARAGLAEAEAAAAEAAANAERARSLQATGALSASQINQYLTAEKTAQARVQAARASFEAQQVRLNQAQVLAPDDGVISARTATVGAVIGNGTELFRLIRQGRLEWRAEVTSTELGRVQAGTLAQVTAASGARLEGRVRTIGPTVDPQSRAALVYVDLQPLGVSRGIPDFGSARAGMFGRGEFQLGSSTAVTVPQAAVVLREGFSYLMRVQPDGRVQQLKVQTGRLVQGQVEITSPLPPDTRVVASGGSFLNDGDLVRVVDTPARDSASNPAPARAASGPSATK
jgi:RND family efflux transporter MFP subunit